MKRLMTIAIGAAAVLLLLGCEEDKVVYVGDIPAVPTGVTSITGDRQVEIQWRSNNDNGSTDGYGVYQYIETVGNQDRYERIGVVDASEYIIDPDSDVRYYSFIVTGLSNGVTYYFAVNAYNQYGESELSKLDAWDTPRPEGEAVMRDFHDYPNSSGFDFSRARVVPYDSDDADVFFEYDPDLEAFFFFAANDDVDIQSFGYTSDLKDVSWGDPGNGKGWSEVGWMELVEDHSYIVQIRGPEVHYATFRVMSLNYGTHSVTIEWAYQTSDLYPQELKIRQVVPPPHAENYGRREGN